MYIHITWQGGSPVVPPQRGNRLSSSCFLTSPFGSGCRVLLFLALWQSPWSYDVKFAWHNAQMLTSTENRKQSFFYLQTGFTRSRACNSNERESFIWLFVTSKLNSELSVSCEWKQQTPDLTVRKMLYSRNSVYSLSRWDWEPDLFECPWHTVQNISLTD